jgi:hypothetical protein
VTSVSSNFCRTKYTHAQRTRLTKREVGFCLGFVIEKSLFADGRMFERA